MTVRPEPPAGTVTCVFTDIEGSTRLLRELGPCYDDLLAQHDEILRRVWDDHDGYEVKTLGDSFMVMFQHALDAVVASVAAERSLCAADWPTELPVRVRIGMHTGFARPKGGDYTALVVHQAARVTSAARGGQVLLTETTAADVETAGEAVGLRRLGRFRVRDFDEPVALYTAQGPGVPQVDAPPRVRPADGHNLVPPATSLVGRSEDVASLADRVAPGRVTTIVGPGGVGKTRLATETALAVADHWADGAWFVDLAPIGDGALVPEAIGDAVGAAAAPRSERWSDVLAHLAQRRMLVVLDNCEHLPEASGRAASELVAGCPGVAVLATSRRSLGLRGEHVHRLAPLGSEGAIALFRDRSAGDVHADGSVLADLCRELDGLPLAIELAAARAAAVPPDEILRRLRRAPAVIRSEDPTLPERQRSLARLLDWSWELLSPAARAVLARLSVFAGSFDLAAAERVAAGAGDEPDEVAGIIWELVDASLVRPEETAGATRYRLLATVRAHAAAHDDTTDLAAAARRLAELLLERVGPARATRYAWVAEMELELDNARGAIARVDDDATAQALAWSVGRYHDAVDAYADASAELIRVLESRPEPTANRVALLAMVAILDLRLGETARAEAALSEAAALEREVGDPEWDEAAVARARGELALRRDDPSAAAAEALDGLARARSPWARARLNNLLGLARRDAGDLDGAVEAIHAELEAATQAAAHTFLVVTHANLAEVELLLGDERTAAFHQAISLGLARELRRPVYVAFALMISARLVAARGRPADAVVLQTKADDLLAEADIVLYADDERIRTALLDDAAGRLTRDELEAAVAAGHALSADAAADLADDIFAAVGSQSTTTTTRRT